MRSDYLAEVIGENCPTTSELVRSLVRQLLPAGAVTLPDFARHSGPHPKTLERRLAAEHTTFADLVDQIRRDTAQRLLLDTELSLDQLGYAEQSVLTRSCNAGLASRPPPTATRRNAAPPPS